MEEAENAIIVEGAHQLDNDDSISTFDILRPNNTGSIASSVSPDGPREQLLGVLDDYK